MKATGIIVEYNPLHYGHIHHIEKTRLLSGCDVLIAVMSGNVVQRGEFSSFDKFTKTKWALQSGVDIVVELPGVFSLQNANIFAHTSVDILNKMGVDSIYFLSESGELAPLKMSAEIMRTDAFDERIKSYLSKGYSYPSSADKAMNEMTDQQLHKNPNDILGIQYINAVYTINPNIKIEAIKRIGSGYYDNFNENSNIQSATSIRQRLLEGKSIENSVPSYVNDTRGLFMHHIKAFPYIRYNLSTHDAKTLKRIFSCDEGIEGYLLKHAHIEDFDALINALSTRRYTHAKIKRTLMFILLNIEKDRLENFTIPYLRVLGMNSAGQRYLSLIKNDLDIPLITKIKRERHHYLDLELRISKLYSLISGDNIYDKEFDPVMIL